MIISLIGLHAVLATFLICCDASTRNDQVEPTEEFRALYIATVDNIDWPRSSENDVASQQLQLLDYVKLMNNTNMNAVMFHVRTTGDALYNSPIEPWSKYMTGVQGTPPDPFWDPLEEIIKQCHPLGIEVHAWLNPYRANLSPNWDGLADNHMAIVHRQYAYPYSTYLWMDPGAQVVIDQLVNVVVDIINRYDVDGIHVDDYFYPYPDGTHFPDNSTYNAYLTSGGNLPLDDWRRDNVNQMINRVYSTIKSIRPSVKFSVSPFGLYRPGEPEGMPYPITGFDPYSQIYADAKLWLAEGWVDFLAPQLYWEINSTGQSYPMILDWWLDNNPKGKHIYAANGVYRIPLPTDWPVSEIEAQIEISRDVARREKFSLGNIMFSAKYFRDNTKNITDIFQANVYTMKATVPPTP